MLGLGLGTNKGGFVGSPPYFAMTIDTTKSGVSNNDQFQFTGAQGQYNVDAAQNDVIVQSYAGLVDQQTITLPSAGIYQVRVYPKQTSPFNRINFDNSGDKEKILSIDSFGNIKWSSFGNAFRGCINLETIKTNPDLSLCNDLGRMFEIASSFNSDIANWNTSNITVMFQTFRSCISFKQDISSWNVENVTTMQFAFFGIDMNSANTTTNYDNLLIKWSQQNVKQNVPFHAGNSKYNPNATLAGYSVTAGQAKQILINNGWTITDGGTI